MQCELRDFVSHDIALEHVNLSLELLENARRAVLMDQNGTYFADPDSIQNSRQLEDFDPLKADQYKSIITTMIIGHYNFGTELEYLHRYHESALAYGRGLELAQDELGETHPLTQSLNKNYTSLLVRKQVKMCNSLISYGITSNSFMKSRWRRKMRIS